MAKRTRDTKKILRTIERSKQRSSLFWWMVEHHEELRRVSERQRIDWRAFCAEAGRLGLTDTSGRLPTEGNARETWRQARRAVAERRRGEAGKPPPQPGSVYPSRMPKNSRPVAVTSAQGSGLVQASTADACKDDQPYDWRKRLAQLNRTIDERSGRKG